MGAKKVHDADVQRLQANVETCQKESVARSVELSTVREQMAVERGSKEAAQVSGCRGQADLSDAKTQIDHLTETVRCVSAEKRKEETRKLGDKHAEELQTRKLGDTHAEELQRLREELAKEKEAAQKRLAEKDENLSKTRKEHAEELSRKIMEHAEKFA